MFITIGTIAQHVSDIAGQLLLASGGRKSTPTETAECINRLIINGDPGMHAANAEFDRVFSIKAA